MKLLELSVLQYFSPHFIHSLTVFPRPSLPCTQERHAAHCCFSKFQLLFFPEVLPPAKAGVLFPGKAPKKPLMLPQTSTLLTVCSVMPRNTLFPNSKPKQNKPLSFHFQRLL